MNRKTTAAFTLVELLVVMAIIGVLISMLLPAIQAAREAARRSSCAQNVSQILIALQGYEGTHGNLPPGVTNPTGPIRNEAIGQHYGWLIHLLPYLDDNNTLRHIDMSAGVYAKENRKVRDVSRQVFMCPSEAGNAANTSSYAGCHHDREAPIDSDNNGVLFLNSKVRYKDITDGVAFTLFIGEKVTDQNDLGWMSGTRATLRNTGVIVPPTNAPTATGATAASPPVDGPADASNEKTPEDESTKPAEQPVAGKNVDPLLYVGPFSSYHSGGVVNFGFGDGSVRAHGAIDPQAYRRMGNRADGELVETDAF